MISYKDREQIRAYTDNIEPPYEEYEEPDKKTCMICGEEIDSKHGICVDCKSNVIYVLKKAAHENAIDDYDEFKETDVEKLGGMMCDAIYEFSTMGIKGVDMYEALLEVFDW